MPAPVSIAHVHVHALRLASGTEALVARVLTVDGVAGFGFSFGPEAFPARDMAAWDATARSRKLPLYALFGKKTRSRIAVVRGPGSSPFNRPLEDVRSDAAEKIDLLAPNSHQWELAYCAALAATLEGEVRIAVPNPVGFDSMPISDAPGIAVEWLLEPAFAAIRWHDPKK